MRPRTDPITSPTVWPRRMLLAAALPENYFTVWHNLFERGRLSAGENVLIHGGASGIGTTAIQLAKAFGATVFTTVRTPEKAKAVRELGADHAIIYKDNDWAGEIKKLSGGVDVVLDMVAGDYVPRNLNCLAEDGRHVSIAVLGGAKTSVFIPTVMNKRLTITGSTLRARSSGFKSLVADELMRTVWSFVGEGKLRPAMDQRFALADAAKYFNLWVMWAQERLLL